MSALVGTASSLLLLFYVFIYADAQVAGPVEQYYRELGCDPPRDGQPNAYNCSILEKLSADKCYHNNKFYNVNDMVKGEDIGAPCSAECVCQKTGEKASWQCVQIECPELFNAPRKECTRLYKPKSCCSVGEYCPEQDEKPEVTCTYNGKTYVKGESFDVSDQCLSCICMEGFNGTLVEPFCSKIKCNLYLHYSEYIKDGCIPTYFESKNCCPIPIWRCPNEDDKVIVQKTAPPATNDALKCRFGSVEMTVGQALTPTEENKCVECTCLAPPHPTCIMNTTCYNGQ